MKTIEFEYDGQPVRLHVPVEFTFEVGDVLNLKREPNGIVLRNTRTGDWCLILHHNEPCLRCGGTTA